MALTTEGPSKRKARWIPRRFVRDERGTTAVEFAIVAIPFLGLVMATLETALFFFAGQAFDTAVHNAARLIRTGQAQEDGLTSDTFRTKICDQLSGFLNCSGIRVDVRKYSTFAAIDLAMPIDEDGNLKKTGYVYQPGNGGDIVVVRAYYEWPVMVNWYGATAATLADGSRLLSSAAAFRNEPFPW
jgi:Flp pilus assembly protein TadG